MPVYIDSIKFQDEYSGTLSGGADTGVPYLMGCVGDLVYASINCRVAWSALNVTCTFSAAKKTITLNYCGNTLAGSGLVVTDNSFTGLGFQVGDTIVVSGTTSGVDDATYTIASLTDTIITVVEVIPQDGVFSGINIYGTTTVNALDFYYNIVPPQNNLRRQPLPSPFNSGRSNNSFISLTDQSAIQKFTGFKGPYSGTINMTPNATSKAWWVKSAGAISCVPVVTDNGVDGSYNYSYTIVFPFLITPFFLANQLQIFQNALSQGNSASLNGNNFALPDYFTNGCLGFICQIDARFNIGSQNADHSTAGITTFQNGNTSWFNTLFPSGVKQGSNLLVDAQYDLISCTYTDNASNPLTSIDVNNPTKVKLKISGGTSWAAAKYVLNFMWLPTNAGDYQGYSQKNQVDFREVFLHDRCKTVVGAGAQQGDQYLTPLQAITSLTSTIYNYGLDLELDFTIDLGSLSKSTLNADTQRNYLIWVTPQDASIASLSTSNRNAVIGDVNQAFVNTDDATLLNIITGGTTDVHFFNYPNNTTNPLTDWKQWSGEYGLAKCDFEVKPNCIIKDVNVSFEAQVYDGGGNTVATFPLESWNNQTDSFFDGKLNQIVINETRDFNLPDGDLRNTRSINRKGTTVDADGSWPFSLIYGFQLGYRFWQNLQNVVQQYSRYPVNYWSVFTQTFAGANPSSPVIPAGYTSAIKFKIVWDIQSVTTGVTTQFIRYANIGSYDEGSQIGTNACTIYTTDLLGTDLGQVVATDTPIYVMAQFSGDSLTPPDGYTAVGELVLYYNDGTQIVYDRIMSDDSAPETSKSLWQTIPIISYNASNNTAVVMAKLDLTADPLSLRSAGIYAKIIMKKASA